jgi:hypothetical protein
MMPGDPNNITNARETFASWAHGSHDRQHIIALANEQFQASLSLGAVVWVTCAGIIRARMMPNVRSSLTASAL